MKKPVLFSLIFFVCIAVFFFRQFFVHGFLPLPSDSLVGLYNPFRDFYAQSYPRGIPFKNFLITDPIRQQYPWRYIAIQAEKKLQLPLWNPYSFAGEPLLAGLQSAALYPLNIIFFLLPFPLAWSIGIFLQPFLAGIFFYLYVKNLKVSSISALLGAISFSFSGFFVAWMEWGTILHVALWLPLVLLSIDKLVQEKKVKMWFLIFLFSSVSSFLGGHLQTFFYLGLVSFVYFLTRWFQHGKEKRILFLFISAISIFFILTALQWIPLLQLISLSSRSLNQTHWHEAGWFIPYQQLFQFIAPDFFGNPTTLNYFGVWNYGEMIGYLGILPLITAIYASCIRRDKHTWFFTILFLISLLFALPTLISMIPFQLHIPFVSTAQPTRLLFIIDFSLAVLGSLGFDVFVKSKKNVWVPILVIGMCFAVAWIMIIGHNGLSLNQAIIAKHNFILPSIIFLVSSLLLLVIEFGRKYMAGKVVTTVCLLLLFIFIFDMVRFADKFLPFTPVSYAYPQTKVIQFLQNNIGNYRFMTLDDRILPPNVESYYHLSSVNGYNPLYLQSYGEFASVISRDTDSIANPVDFNRIIRLNRYKSSFIDLLGVKYILTLSDITDSKLKKVLQEGETRIYENLSFMPRAFFVHHILAFTDKQESMRELFHIRNALQTRGVIACQSCTVFTNTIFTVGNVAITSYEQNSLTLETKNSGEGFLILTDTYYPTWHATIDGQETRIYPTDFLFRGIEVPRGTHHIVFSDRLF